MLEGIPGTIKDSYMMEGMTVASGSLAFVNLTATADAFTTSQLRGGGGLIMGKTTMPPMANGGMQRGVYGRAESPYNKGYLAAAYASGSSNGGGSSTAASMAVFAMAEETVSSGRSPASNNGLVAYTPSRGVLSIRGNWPLFPVADVVVPYARTVEDMFDVLDVIVADDEDTTSDFWRGQPFVQLPSASSLRPGDSYHSLANVDSLRGKRIGVPKMYIGEYDAGAQPMWVNPRVIELWAKARATLESLGAVVEEVGFPLVTNSESAGETSWETDYPLPGPAPDSSRGPFEINAYAWDNFLVMVNDTAVSGLTSLTEVDPELIFPQLPNTLMDRYGGSLMDRTGFFKSYIELAADRNGTSIYDLPGLGPFLQSLEEQRKRDLESWMDESGLDALVWPSVGDIGAEDAETDETAAIHAWRNGVYFSNGNYAIREFGVPTVSVSMGKMSGTGMPVDLTFASKAYDDSALLSYGYAFETAHEKRPVPPLTPELPTDVISRRCSPRSTVGTVAPKLTASATKLCDGNAVEISGSVDLAGSEGLESIEVFVDGIEVRPVVVKDGRWRVVTSPVPYDDPVGDVPVRVVNEPDQSLAMIVVVATASNGRSDGKLLFV